MFTRPELEGELRLPAPNERTILANSRYHAGPMPTPPQWIAHAVRRGSAIMLAMTLATGSLPVQAQSSLVKKVQKLNAEGQEQYDNQQYEEAAATWLEALELLEEKEGTQATREMLVIQMSEASIEAFHESMDVSVLERARGALAAYAGEYRKVYGSEPSAEVDEAIRSVEHRLETAEGDSGGLEEDAPVGLSDEEEEPVSDKKKRDKAPKDKTGIGLIATGTTFTVLGMGAFGVMAVGMALGAAAENDFINAPDQYGRIRAQDRGSTGNALAITGAIIGPVLLAAGIPMLVIGARKRARAKVAFQLNPSYAGLSLGGRF